MKKDVIITTVKDYDWAHIMSFVVSLDRTGFEGEKVIFVENISQQAQNKLTQYGWTSINAVVDPALAYSSGRYEPILKYLSEHEFRFVIIVDARDVIFQSNPITWLENNLAPYELIGASECVLIKNQNVNSRWVRESMGEEMEKWLGDYDVCCAGTIIGTQIAVVTLCQKILELAKNVSSWGYEQAYLNYLIRIPPLEDITNILKMKEGFIISCSWFLCDSEIWKPFLTDESPIFDHSNTLIYAPNTKIPFSIVHQYDRNWWWKTAIEQKYSDLVI